MEILFSGTPLESWWKTFKTDEKFPARHGPLRGIHLSDAIRPAVLSKVYHGLCGMLQFRFQCEKLRLV